MGQPFVSTITLLNARSISPASNSSCKWKIPYLEEYISRDPSSVTPFLAITESWLKPHITDAQIAIQGYRSLRSDRDTRKGGGCVLYAHNSITTSGEFSYSDNHISLISCYVESKNLFVSVIYRPPGTPVSCFSGALKKLQDQIDAVPNPLSPDLYIMGDFNLPHIDWTSRSILSCQSASDSESCNQLLSFMDKNFLSQLVDLPTKDSNILDLVLTNKSQDILKITAPTTKLSDHNLVKIVLGHNITTFSPSVKNPIDPLSFRAVDYHNADFNAINDALRTIDWHGLRDMIHDDSDGEQFLELIRLTVLQITLAYSPHKVSGGQTKRPKGNRERNKLKRRRRKVKARLSALNKGNPDSRSIPKLKKEVNLLSFEIKESITRELNQREAKAVKTIKSNPRYFFSFAKRFAKVKSTVGPFAFWDIIC